MYQGRIEGFGLIEWPDGRIYEGEFIDCLREGYGIYKWANNSY